MIICTTFQRQNENVNLTLAASFSHLLTDFLKKVGINVSSIPLPKKVSNFPCKYDNGTTQSSQIELASADPMNLMGHVIEIEPPFFRLLALVIFVFPQLVSPTVLAK